ncbi:hypothetical protein ASPZODRAFT_90128 [Penicilliopsis zonata CBS 506.65]|uniref:Cytomegalovirus gH-receptor family protein n=1 Tax=Penicilliopsis zonata CBS 506.65 TaxID=1073090 RepID=A0A1L9SSN9_9EURO|nr:hypothetical protein ASPZODRAFT_90128 [Penicilliopsis zonata CBS 506.65]OJJ50199.1 hypothetical protein ASPZODRAFT_90128 [Penicilliopsis zonata CBS 506.65]
MNAVGEGSGTSSLSPTGTHTHGQENEDGPDSRLGSVIESQGKTNEGGTRAVLEERTNGLKSGQSAPLLPEQGLGIVLEHSSKPGVDGSSSTSVVDVLDGPGISAALRSLASQDVSPRSLQEGDQVLKLSLAKPQEPVSSPESNVPQPAMPESNQHRRSVPETVERQSGQSSADLRQQRQQHQPPLDEAKGLEAPFPSKIANGPRTRPHASRTISTPTSSHRQMPTFTNERLASTWSSRWKPDRPSISRIDADPKINHPTPSAPPLAEPLSSSIPPGIPLPPLSIPTYLQLELASGRPSPLYIYRSSASDFPYESSRVKLERLMNFLMIPPVLEQVLWFGALACLDSWLYSFTILPLRFIKALYILITSWVANMGFEIQSISGFVVKGVGRVWRRRSKGSFSAETSTEAGTRSRNPSSGSIKPLETLPADRDVNSKPMESTKRHRRSETRKHRRQKSIPSALLPEDKADILKGLLMIFTCCVLMFFDASRMYHWIRGQAAIKLYVIYNVLEVSDRLFAAIGQDVLECLFSREALERKPDGRSKVSRPFCLFLLALVYTVVHSTALFYQVMTLNVAVNSYSNALITLLLSNQFVEIKSTVFKKFEKENLFQLTCADVVERFQLWLMLTIIASRNIVETGTFNFFGSLGSLGLGGGSSAWTGSTNSTPLSTPPRTAASILPQAFTMFPTYLFSSVSSGANSFLPTVAQVLGPFLVVLGSEMLVDWLKHAYIGKFNNTRPKIYGRFLDILAKDYYTNAFADQNLTRRLGLPVIPLSCLFFRVSVQTYQMFLAAWLPQPPSSSSSSFSSVSVAATTLATIQSNRHSSVALPSATPLTLSTVIPASMAHVNSFLRTMLANAIPSPAQSVRIFTVLLILTGFVILLILKLLLGMVLLAFARSRYRAMKETETSLPPTSTPQPTSQLTSTAPRREYVVEGSRRVGGWGVVEVNEDKRRWIYSDDAEGLRRLKEKEERDKSGKEGVNMELVSRYEMVAKRIW